LLWSEERVAVDAVSQQAPLELEQRFLLNLADALARQTQTLRQYFQRFRFAVAQAVTARKHLAFALVEIVQAVLEQQFDFIAEREAHWVGGAVVRNDGLAMMFPGVQEWGVR